MMMPKKEPPPCPLWEDCSHKNETSITAAGGDHHHDARRRIHSRVLLLRVRVRALSVRRAARPTGGNASISRRRDGRRGMPAALGASLLSSPSSSSTEGERRACVLTLLRILDNVLNDPDGSEPKLRRIRASSPAFWRRCGRWDGSAAFLVEGCGFAGSGSGSTTGGGGGSGGGAGGGGAGAPPSILRLEDEDRRRLLRGRGELVGLAAGRLGIAAGSLPDPPPRRRRREGDAAGAKADDDDGPADAGGGTGATVPDGASRPAAAAAAAGEGGTGR